MNMKLSFRMKCFNLNFRSFLGLMAYNSNSLRKEKKWRSPLADLAAKTYNCIVQ